MYTANNISEKLKILYLFAYMYIREIATQPVWVTFGGPIHRGKSLGPPAQSRNIDP